MRTALLIYLCILLIDIWCHAFHLQKVTLTNLDPDTNYQIDVAGYTIKGDGARSLTKFGKTLPRPPDAPFVYSRILNKQGDVEIGWRTSAKGVIGYQIRYGKTLIRKLVAGRNNNSIPMKHLRLGAGNSKKVFNGLGKELHQYRSFQSTF